MIRHGRGLFKALHHGSSGQTGKHCVCLRNAPTDRAQIQTQFRGLSLNSVLTCRTVKRTIVVSCHIPTNSPLVFMSCLMSVNKSRDSSVGIALGYGLDDRGF
jgi:hypothetical protein